MKYTRIARMNDLRTRDGFTLKFDFVMIFVHKEHNATVGGPQIEVVLVLQEDKENFPPSPPQKSDLAHFWHSLEQRPWGVGYIDL